MKNLFLLPVLIFLFGFDLSAQNHEPLLKVSLSVKEGSKEINLEIGIDPAATDSIDRTLGEEELPPLPPPGIFDARLTGKNIGINLGNGSLKDFRSSSPRQDSAIYQLSLQNEENSHPVIFWNFPENISGTLQDFFNGVIVHLTISGSGSFELTNSTIKELKFIISYKNVTRAEIEKPQPEFYKLEQNYPNPFNSVTRINFHIPAAAVTTLIVYDALGQEVARLIDQELGSGQYEFPFDASSLPGGFYFYQLRSSASILTMKMILLK